MGYRDEPSQHDLRLFMRRNCEGEKCCEPKNNTCTPYSTGAISSKHLYGYGKYNFVVQAGQNPNLPLNGDVHAAWSCVGLQRHHFDSDGDPIAIRLCLSSIF